jgi:hypothetical protein
MTLRVINAVAFFGIVALTAVPPLSAHCDTMDGPVVAAARAALQAGDVTPVLKWIPKSSEPEIRAAFTRTLKVRTASADARELADIYFFETLVRLHRAGEGEPYTGLKPAGAQVDPAIAAADKALQGSSADRLVRVMTDGVSGEIRHRFDQAVQTRKMADRSVEAGREYVAAYVSLMHYLEQMGQAGGGPESERHSGK